MATSDVTLCNVALSRVGEQSITSLTDNTERARLCNRIYADTRDRLLDEIRPNCAVARVALPQLTATPAFGFDYQYQLPADCLRVLGTDDSEDTWRIEGRALLSDLTAVEVRYVKRLEDVTQFSPSFTEALVAELAALLAFPVSKSDSLAQLKRKEAEARKLECQASEGVEGTPAVVECTTLLDVR